MSTRRVLLACGCALLLVTTVVVFRAFDRHSHSASDTLRPFLLVMGPLWLAAVVGTRALGRRTGV